ncbi:MAG: dTDP-4-dehydrorhamnose reductase [Saprospiraceae bacterium]|nr:dTDP-4-dehydrorhamnose reductase [Saprospiraceae bacterium]
MRILVTGAGGQIGQALAKAARPGHDLEWHFLDREDLDLTDEDMVMQYVRFLQPDVVINGAAYTAVDQAEQDVDAVFALNRDAVSYLAAACNTVNAQFVHLSTDYVYDNGKNEPYQEDDAVRPMSVYARSKRAGEEEALLMHEETVIIRTSWLYGPVRHNFLRTMLRLGREKQELGIVYDQIGSPTLSTDLAEAIVHIMEQQQADPSRRKLLKGIFNYSNEGVCSWYDFAVSIMRLSELNCQVKPIRTAEYPTPAHRPVFSVMDKQKIKSTFGLRIPHWQSSLERCIRDIQSEGNL